MTTTLHDVWMHHNKLSDKKEKVSRKNTVDV